MKRKPVVVVLHGPSGVGKDTVIDLLREKTGIHRATSSTSRPPRPKEIDGVSYHFISAAEFEAKIEADEFAEYARVYDDWKGVEKREILPYLDEGVDVIIRTDVQGARTWRSRLVGAVFIFLTAEDRDILRTRLIERDTEDGRSLAIRMEQLEKELEDMPNNDHVVFNRSGQIDAAVCEIERIIEHERANPSRPSPHLVA